MHTCDIYLYYRQYIIHKKYTGISLQQSEGKVTSTFPTMTIVAKEDTRNKSWSEGSIGAKLLGKLGWTEGQGLGRNKQGTSHALVAIRRADGVGLGATSNDQDTTGWKDTNDNFASVLRNLQSEHATATSSNSKTMTTRTIPDAMNLSQRLIQLQ